MSLTDEQDERNREWDKKGEPGHRDDAMSLARILERIADSTGRAA